MTNETFWYTEHNNNFDSPIDAPLPTFIYHFSQKIHWNTKGKLEFCCFFCMFVYGLGVYAMSVCWRNVRVLIQCSGVHSIFVFCCIIWVLIHCSGVDPKFEYLFIVWVLCNFWVIMQYLGVYAMNGCLCKFECVYLA